MLQEGDISQTSHKHTAVQVYQDLCQVHKTFRDRSENVDVSVEVTLQPWHAFKPDGVVLFSDILTPLTGMNIPFDIIAGTGPVISKPIRTLEDVATVGVLDAEGQTPYVGGALEKVSPCDCHMSGPEPHPNAVYIILFCTRAASRCLKLQLSCNCGTPCHSLQSSRIGLALRCVDAPLGVLLRFTHLLPLTPLRIFVTQRYASRIVLMLTFLSTP